jgi:prepilin-type N-terminal cleavage/methylation domain-containing protein
VKRSLHAGRRSGFTILEVLVAMGILLVGMSAVLGLLSFGAAMTRNAALKSAGASAVEAVVADLEEGFFPLVRDEATGEVRVGAPTAIEDRPVPGHPGLTYFARGTPDPGDKITAGGALRWRVDVEIRWTTAGRAKSRTFTTLLLRQVPFGERLRRELIEGQGPANGSQKP